MDCPFCNLNEERNRVLYRNENLFVILSNPRLMPGHTLVIPRKHVGALYELEPAITAEIFEVTFRFQRKMIEIFSARWNKGAGCDVSWHTRPFMPQTELSVPGHAHIHLRPRYFNDLLYQDVQKYETDVFQGLSYEEMTEFRRLLSE